MRVRVMKEVLEAKARGCEEFVSELRSTGVREIEEVVWGQTFWGIHRTKGLRGRNMLGVLLMDVRKRLVHVLQEGDAGQINTQSNTRGQGMETEGKRRRDTGGSEGTEPKRMRAEGTNEGGAESYRFQVGGGDLQQGGNTGLFYGTSQLREMVMEENEGLAATTIERGWGINMWRGGAIEHIRKMVNDTDWEKVGEQMKWAVIVAGGNDIASTEPKWDGEKLKEGSDLKRVVDEKLDAWRDMVRVLRGKVERVVVWMPAMRLGGNIKWWISWVGKLCKIAMEEGATVQWIMENTVMSVASFREEMKGTDGVHYTGNIMRKVVRDSLKVLEEDPTLLGPRKKMTFEKVFGGRCGRCGDTDHRRGGCGRKVKCGICGDEHHGSGVCWDGAVVCTSCGKRGHKKNKCREDRNTSKYAIL